MPHGRIEELIDLALRHTEKRGEGHITSALPGLWLYRYDSPPVPVRKRSSSMFLSVALQGQKRMRLAGAEFLYNHSSYLVVRGETEYEGAPIHCTPQQPYLALVLALPPELVLRTLLELADDDTPAAAATSLPAFQGPLDAPLIDTLCRLVQTLDHPLERRVLAPLAIHELVFRLLRSPAASVLRQGLGQRAERERIKSAMEYIAQHAHKKLSVQAVAKRVAMSPSHFAHRFREIASVSPMRYQKHVRMERARELLLHEGLRSGLIAERVGYLSEAQFTRDFKRQFGLAPSAYARAFARENGDSKGAQPTQVGTAQAATTLSAFAESSKNSAGAALGQLHAAS